MDNNKSIKHPYLSLDEQLKHLKVDKGLIITDKTFAQIAIQTFSYYSLINGYKDLFIDTSNSEGERFIPGTTFEMLYQSHWMDLTLNNIILKYSLIVEKKLKSILGNHVAHCHSIYESRYLDKKSYSSSTSLRPRFYKLTQDIESVADDSSVKHYKESEGNVPPWIYAKALSFGATINWYNLLRKPHKIMVISDFLSPINIKLNDDEKLDFFKRGIKQIHQFRNMSAHGNRLFSFKLREKNKQLIRHLENSQLKEYFLDEHNNATGNDGLFSVIFSIFLFINDSYVLNNFLAELYGYLLEYSRAEYNFAGKNVYDLLGINENFFFNLVKFYNKKFNVDISAKYDMEAIKISTH